MFTLTPATSEAGLLDYAQTAHVKLYKAATEPLDTRFDGENAKLAAWLDLLEERATAMGWGAILSIPTPAGSRNLLAHYGSITLDQVRAHANTYIGQTAGALGRRAQNSVMLYTCLSHSITFELRTKIITRKDEYTIAGSLVGALFLKVIITAVYVDTRATTAHLRLNLSRLDTYIGTVENNIGLFNASVRTQVQGLYARGETTNDTLINLFKAYEVVPDKTFRDCIAQKRSAYRRRGRDHRQFPNGPSGEQVQGACGVAALEPTFGRRETHRRPIRPGRGTQEGQE